MVDTQVLLRSKLILRNDTSDNWIIANPILLEGEVGVEINTRKFKIGDGATPWKELPYPDYMSASSEELETIKDNIGQLQSDLSVAQIDIETMKSSIDQIESDVTQANKLSTQAETKANAAYEKSLETSSLVAQQGIKVEELNSRVSVAEGNASSALEVARGLNDKIEAAMGTSNIALDTSKKALEVANSALENYNTTNQLIDRLEEEVESATKAALEAAALVEGFDSRIIVAEEKADAAVLAADKIYTFDDRISKAEEDAASAAESAAVAVEKAENVDQYTEQITNAEQAANEAVVKVEVLTNTITDFDERLTLLESEHFDGGNIEL